VLVEYSNNLKIFIKSIGDKYLYRLNKSFIILLHYKHTISASFHNRSTIFSNDKQKNEEIETEMS
jgi:hypothetical protein